jgi:hypothetical protein
MDNKLKVIIGLILAVVIGPILIIYNNITNATPTIMSEQLEFTVMYNQYPSMASISLLGIFIMMIGITIVLSQFVLNEDRQKV